MTLLLLLALTAQAAPAPAADIVVRARRTGAALAECLAKTCPTADDIRLSIAQAELQFAQGAYRDARNTLGRSIARNRQAAKQYPRMVAALYEASATVNRHYGDMEANARAMAGQAKALRENLPENDPQVLLLNIDLGDFYAHRGDWHEAERLYAASEKGYAARGEQRLAALSALRAAYMALSRNNRDLSEARLRAVSQMPAASDPVVAQLSAVLGARIAAARGDQSGIDALIARLRTDPSAAPVLLQEDRIDANPSQGTANDAIRYGEQDINQARSGDMSPLQWADIGFLVTRDGGVSDVEVLRGNRQQGWTARYVKQVASRRYAPLALAAGQPGQYRIERFTLRASLVVPKGSLVRQRGGPPEVEVLDLTKIDAKPPA